MPRRGAGLFSFTVARIRNPCDNPEVDSPPPHGGSPLAGQTRCAVCPIPLTAVGDFGEGWARVSERPAPAPGRHLCPGSPSGPQGAGRSPSPTPLGGAVAFVPQFDADGNQTLIKAETGIWTAVYNAENRPVTFTNSDSNTVVECQYDSMRRRAYKKVTVNGSVTLHQRYIYRGYLQIACLDLTHSHHPVMWLVTWAPTQPVATRLLAIRINGTWYTFL